MKKSMPIVAIFGIASVVAFAQADNAHKKSESHGKTISSLAKSIPGGKEKGQLISSAARQNGVRCSNGVYNNPSRGNAISGAKKAGTSFNNGKPSGNGKPPGLRVRG